MRQIEDTYEAKNGRMILYLQKVRDLLKKFVLVQIKHVPRSEISRADALAKLTTASQEDLSNSTPVEYLAEPSIDLCDIQVAQIISEPSWMEPIWDYIVDGNHIGARALAGKVLRQGYYWPTILKDATDLVKKCRICQEHAKISRLPSEPLTSITSPWPFQ